MIYVRYILILLIIAAIIVEFLNRIGEEANPQVTRWTTIVTIISGALLVIF